MEGVTLWPEDIALGLEDVTLLLEGIVRPLEDVAQSKEGIKKYPGGASLPFLDATRALVDAKKYPVDV